MIRKILFAADLGVHMPYLLQHVLAVSQQHGAAVVVLHAVSPVSLIANTFVAGRVETMRRQLSRAEIDRILGGIRQRIVDVLADELIDGNAELNCVCDVRVVCGHPAEMILTESAHAGVDLIVMGRSRSSSNERAGELGSVAARVLQGARVPVYLVPTFSPAAQGGAGRLASGG